MNVPVFKLVPIVPTEEMLDACFAFNGSSNAKSIYAAMIAAAPAVVQEEVSEWQPIATAPKGECILLFTSGGIVEARWEYGSWEQMPCYATYDGCGGVALSCQPTHWMPLPAAPKVTA